MRSVVVLFYRYFLPTPADASGENDSNKSSVINEATLQFFQKHASSHYLPKLQKHQYDLHHKLTRGGTIKGRLLISKEGINGTLSFPTREELKEYMTEMEAFDLIRDLGVPPTLNNDKDSIPKIGGGRIFTGIDWKISTTDDLKNNNHRGPFPDLKIQIVKEIVNTGGTIHLNDIPNHGGKEISPKEFHQILIDAEGDKQEDTKKKEVVLIDVRNTFEHSIGHFLHPQQQNAVVDSSSSVGANVEKASSSDGTSSHSNTIPTSTPAINPNTVTFSHFDSTFCSQNADSLKDKKVLMYCTGGIRCVKASAMLKQRGVADVSHLSGGIHRYVEEFGSQGFYKGKVFVFDQRVALDPDSMASVKHNADAKVQATNDEGGKVVGQCIECTTPYDQISGATLCTVCRDLILLCRSCKSSLNEFHCERHQLWKSCYFTFLERYSLEELTKQRDRLQKLHDTKYVPPKEHRNVRKTLRKQMDKVLARIRDIQTGEAAVDKNTKRRCRTCFDPEDVCDGLCWGFWRSLQSPIQKLGNDCKLQPMMEVKTGDRVTPGPDWNTLRHGKCFRDLSPEPRQPLKRQRNYASDEDKQSTSKQRNPKTGTVVEVKSWTSGGTEMDSVSVLWDADPNQEIICEGSRSKRKSKCGDDDSQVQSNGIYRWGAIARNGRRMYDVKLVS